MLGRVAEKTAASVAEKVGAVIDSKMNPKTEWHRFSCELGHSFAVELHTGISTKKIMEFYSVMKCPLCYTEELNKENNL